MKTTTATVYLILPLTKVNSIETDCLADTVWTRSWSHSVIDFSAGINNSKTNNETILSKYSTFNVYACIELSV